MHTTTKHTDHGICSACGQAVERDRWDGADTIEISTRWKANGDDVCYARDDLNRLHDGTLPVPVRVPKVHDDAHSFGNVYRTLSAPVVGDAVVQTRADNGTLMIGGEHCPPRVMFVGTPARCASRCRALMDARWVGSRAHYRLVVVHDDPQLGPAFVL